jgi:type VI secretion system secreted protein Hcp
MGANEQARLHSFPGIEKSRKKTRRFTMRSIHRGRLFVLCGVVSALLAAVPAMAEVNAYMTVKGVKQGLIKSEGGYDRIQLINVVRNASMGSDIPAGRRMHSTITVTKKVDVASPKLAAASSSGETLSEVVITFEGRSGDAKTAQKIVLTNATISNIRWVGGNEEITFDYQNIEVTYASGGKTATDDWNAPN